MFHLADIWATRTGSEVRLVSANDHVHARRSAHYAGLAIDLHSSDPDGLARMMRSLGYRVLWRVPGHYSHVHIERAAEGQQPARGSERRPDVVPVRRAGLQALGSGLSASRSGAGALTRRR
jgi:hypothetical protein